MCPEEPETPTTTTAPTDTPSTAAPTVAPTTTTSAPGPGPGIYGQDSIFIYKVASNLYLQIHYINNQIATIGYCDKSLIVTVLPLPTASPSSLYYF